MQHELGMKNKQLLLQWVTDADFCNDFNLRQLADHPFEVEPAEVSIQHDSLLKIVKVLAYKIGLGYKRMDLVKQ